MQSKNSNIGYVPELDGLRGFAIAAVMIYHAKESFLKGGFLGVDIFFVLSGFLITSLLVREFNGKQYVNLKNFYLRRVLRLAPALIAFLAIFASASVVIMNHDKAKDNLIDVFVALVYFTNWVWAFNLHDHHPNFLVHTWSLSIEEQFYILWPIILITLLGCARSRRQVVLVITVLVFSSWLWRIYLAVKGSFVERLYTGLDTRADDLLIGCLLGVILSSNLINEHCWNRFEKELKFFAPLCALGLVCFCIFTPDRRNIHMYYWGFFVVAIMTDVVILDIFISSKSITKQILSTKPPVLLGIISYGLYLWHHPIYMAMRLLTFHGIQILIIGSCLTFLVASASYCFLERPLLRLKNRVALHTPHTSLPLTVVERSGTTVTEAGTSDAA